MFYTIYKITNKVNGKIYVGKHQTKDLNDDYMGSGKYLRQSISKHGLENFEKEILFVFDTEKDMNAKEAEIVTEEFSLREDTYNICVGGNGGFGYINANGMNTTHQGNFKNRKDAKMIGDRGRKSMWTFSSEEEQREFIKKTQDTRKRNMGDRYFLAHFTGKKHTEETKEKMRKSKNVGTNNSQFGTMWITNGQENKKIKKEDPIPQSWYNGRVTI